MKYITAQVRRLNEWLCLRRTDKNEWSYAIS